MRVSPGFRCRVARASVFQGRRGVPRLPSSAPFARWATWYVAAGRAGLSSSATEVMSARESFMGKVVAGPETLPTGAPHPPSVQTSFSLERVRSRRTRLLHHGGLADLRTWSRLAHDAGAPDHAPRRPRPALMQRVR